MASENKASRTMARETVDKKPGGSARSGKFVTVNPTRIRRTRKADPYRPDDETAPLTDEEVATLRPTPDIFAELGLEVPRTRGPQKAPTKKQVTLRLDENVVEYFKAGGRGWQTRLNDELVKLVAGNGGKRHGG
ncbi:MAG: BrnA antitoxin family protein [Rhodobiaceae bacterium]|nr:BrnA antitoxin family protein [Rhodobiaceae bacterium]